jgi:deazaflavin-dependent oxidoreductase (nitroreductase family)
LGRIGSHPAAVWAVKHLVSPLDRMVVRMSRGRLPPPSAIAVPTLLLTTVGRRSGRDRTIPLVYLRDGVDYVVANARPAGERPNPWVVNLGAAGGGRIRVLGETVEVSARQPEGAEAERLWNDLVGIWPAFEEHYAATGERTVFVLEPLHSTTEA